MATNPMPPKKSISLDYQDNPELREVFSRKEIGEKCKLTIKLQVDRKDDTGMDGTILEISPSEDYSDEEKMDESHSQSSRGKKRGKMEPMLMAVDQGTNEPAPSLDTIRIEAYGR